MTEFLETTHGKFIFKVRTGYLYTSDDFWVGVQGNVGTVGLSDYLQKARGDVAIIETVTSGTQARKGQALGTIETIKSTFEILSPVSGKVIEVNPELEARPNLINDDPYGAGWICRIELSDLEGEKGMLLEAESYLTLLKEKIAREAEESDDDEE